MNDSATRHLAAVSFLFPLPEPSAIGRLPVDARHTLYWKECGNRDGPPVVFLHGGPGGGCLPHHRRFFDPDYWRIVLFDQRVRAGIRDAMQPNQVQRTWPDATVVCIAGGPSLTLAQMQLVYDWRMSGACRVIVINNGYELASWADALYFADHRWYRWHKDKPLFQQFRGERYSIENAGSTIDDERVTVLRNLSVVCATMCRLCTDPTGLYTAMNGGYQAIGIAVHKGARRIVLLGYDMKPDAEGRHHWHKEHPVPMDGNIYRFWRDEYTRMAPTAKEMGIEILNATVDTALDMFPRVALESLVTDTHAAALPT